MPGEKVSLGCGGSEEWYLVVLDAMSRFFCVSPPVDPVTQSLEGCEQDGWVNASCFAAFNVSCGGEEYNASQCIFQQRQPCRYV